jgi:phenylpyruvate tautomerase PptA (4-oxalocrotonate tautomerase family)
VSIRPQLSSVSTALAELTSRVSELAENASGTEREDVAVALYEVERSLQTANRRLEQLVADLR